MLEINNIHNIDCIEGMKQLGDNSVDLIVTDPPYYKIMIKDYKGKTYDWDKQWESFKDYLDWCNLWFKECKRVLKDNGSLYIFADDKICAYIQVELDKLFNLENNIIWVKPNNLTIKGWSEYRSYSPITERILFYSQGWDVNSNQLIIDEHLKPLNGFAKYLNEEFERAKVTRKEIAKLFPSNTGGLTGCVSNWLNGDNIITKEQYLKIREYINSEKKDYEYLKKDYEDLKKDYEDLRRPFNPKKNFTDVWTFNIMGGKESVNHPTQKPIALIRRIIDTSSKEKDLILDLFMGSGTTAVACKQLNRRFIGFEASEEYCNIAKERLSQNVLLQFTTKQQEDGIPPTNKLVGILPKEL